LYQKAGACDSWLETAMAQFSDAGIDVQEKEGLLIIDLPEKLLFKEGSAKLDCKSKEELSSLASILNDYPKVQIYVIGHTDSVKIHNASFQDNCSLSTERANSFVRTFRDSYKVDPARLLSAGRSNYGPVSSNTTKERRTMNRRIQIVLNPGLNRLLDMME
jgi:chemotaxis protein MotB